MRTNIPSLKHGLPGKQRGVATLVVGLVMLLMLTVVTLYSARISIEEKKTAANHWRTADAFARSEQGLETGFAFFDTHRFIVNSSSTEDITGDGNADLPDGWFPADGTGQHWSMCTANDTALPCGDDGSANVYPSSSKYSGRGWVYKTVPKDDSNNPSPFDTADLQDQYGNLKFDLFLLSECARPDCAEAECARDAACRTTCSGGTCTSPSACGAGDPTCSFLALNVDGNFSYTLMARGYSDDDTGQAVVRRMVASHTRLGGRPAAPIIATGDIGVSGNFTVVANPDAILYENKTATIKSRGSGVPMSIWSRADVTLGNSAQTCHLGDYLTNGTPNSDKIRTCDDCDCPNNTLLSVGDLAVTNEGIDIVDVDGDLGENPDLVDTCPPVGNGVGSEFPCDLFEYVFQVPGPYTALYSAPVPDDWKDVRDGAQRITDCGALNASSMGLYWYEGAGDCRINGGTVGSWKRPVLLVIDEADLRSNGNATFFGLMFSFDSNGDGTGGDVALNGTFLIYGSIIVDHQISLSAGSFTARYDADVLTNLMNNSPSLAYLPGGWIDFPPAP